MAIGRFKAHFGSRIWARLRNSSPASAIELPRHNPTSEAQLADSIGSSASAHDK
jgi:hypothetical protein